MSSPPPIGTAVPAEPNATARDRAARTDPESAAGRALAERLPLGAFVIAGGRFRWVNARLSALLEYGLSKQRNLTRMCHGPSSEAATTGLIAASAGPEFG